jgi:flagellar hook-length control protein FliK
MQNIAVVNTELKSPSFSNKASDVSANSSEAKADGLFGETLSAELKKVESNHSQADAKSDSEHKKSENLEPQQQNHVKKAEKETATDGNELPAANQQADKSSNELVSTESLDIDLDVSPSVENKQITQVYSEKEQTEINVKSPSINDLVQSDEQVDELKQNLASSNTKLVEQASQAAVSSSVNHQQSKVTNETTSTTPATETNPIKGAITSSEQSLDVDSVPAKSEEGEVTTRIQAKSLQPNSVSSNQADSAEKELVIKQINIAKETSTKVDVPQEKQSIVTTEQKQEASSANRNKPVTVDEGLLADSEQKKAKVAQPTAIKNSEVATKVDVEQAISNTQRETVVLDKRAVQVVDSTLAPAKKVDKKSTVTSAPLASLSSPTVQSTTSSTTPVLDIQPGLKTEAWERVMAGRVVWMAREGLQRAELKLNPASMGPIEVRLTINNDQANVSFVVTNPATREAIEQSLPRLREGLQANGLSLESADVSDQALNQEQEREQYQQAGSGILFSQDVDDELNDEAIVIEKSTDSGLSLYV